MKYLIHKGYQGWGDRLQSLSYCLDFAKLTGRSLYIDWSDPIWSQGNSEYSFDQFLDLKDISRIKSLDDIPSTASVYPAYWTGKLQDQPGIWVHSKRASLEIMLDRDRPEDVIVFTAIGYRKWSAETIMSHLILKDNLIREIQHKLSKIPSQDFYAVHLRGTDRGGYLVQCRHVARQVLELCAAAKLPVVVVSDDETLITEWIKIVPETILLTEFSRRLPTGGLGTHMVPPEKLHKFRMTKGDLNLELLSDFFVYSLGKIYLTNNPASTFSSMAKLLGGYSRPKLRALCHQSCDELTYS